MRYASTSTIQVLGISDNLVISSNKLVNRYIFTYMNEFVINTETEIYYEIRFMKGAF